MRTIAQQRGKHHVNAPVKRTSVTNCQAAAAQHPAAAAGAATSFSEPNPVTIYSVQLPPAFTTASAPAA